jgi:G3E family GTPase
MSKAQYLMVGGFLGAGKTTAILQIAKRLKERGRRVGLITNDQSVGLVDTEMLASHGFPVEEITGGCFCCKFNSLVDASNKLSADARPDVFIAEPVGSCTDLKATVDYPLRRMYGSDFSIAPLSVMVDPVRAMRILGLDNAKSFSKKVQYIYRKQLEEAEIIIVNKIDLLTPQKLDALLAALKQNFPAATVLTASARDGQGIDDWITRITDATAKTAGAMTVDYETYADGEALLGWLNATVNVSSTDSLDGNALLLHLANRLQQRLGEESIDIAHLKMTLTPDEGHDLAVANLVRTDALPELSHRLQETLEYGQLILNLRAEADPDVLRLRVLQTLTEIAGEQPTELKVEHMEHFRPGKPQPTHRLAGV